MKGTTNARKEWLEQERHRLFESAKEWKDTSTRRLERVFGKRSVVVNSRQIRKEDRNGWLRKIKRTRCCRSGDRRGISFIDQSC